MTVTSYQYPIPATPHAWNVMGKHNTENPTTMKTFARKSRVATILSLFILMCSCEGEDGTDGLNSLLSTQVEAAGLNCPAGGLRINHGLDLNSNTILDNSEVESSDYICNGISGTLELDNLTRIELGSPNDGTCETGWYLSQHDTFYLHDFNKLDYTNVASILFVPSMYVTENDVNNFITVELFNITDNVPIPNTQITSYENAYIFKYSENIYDALPNYPITLAIKLKSNDTGSCVMLGYVSYLYILRN
jgi:hypothetical protein